MWGKRLNLIIVAVATTLSLVNIVLFIILLGVRNQITDTATRAERILQQIQTTAPFVTNVAIDNTFKVPIRTDVPINTTVNVPITIPVIGQVTSIAIPIKTDVPVDTTIQVPIKTTVPINVDIANSPFNDILEQLQSLLTSITNL